VILALSFELSIRSLQVSKTIDSVMAKDAKKKQEAVHEPSSQPDKALEKPKPMNTIKKSPSLSTMLSNAKQVPR
jgi:hypothetical protein